MRPPASANSSTSLRDARVHQPRRRRARLQDPLAVREAGIESLEHGRTRYTSNAGLKELRAEIARCLDRRMGLKYDPAKEILVTVGGSEAIDIVHPHSGAARR